MAHVHGWRERGGGRAGQVIGHRDMTCRVREGNCSTRSEVVYTPVGIKSGRQGAAGGRGGVSPMTGGRKRQAQTPPTSLC